MGWATSHLRHAEQLHEAALQEREAAMREYDRYEACQSGPGEAGVPYSVRCPKKLYVMELTSIRPDGRQIRRCVCAREDQVHDPALNALEGCGAATQQCDLH
eukprot:EG_transcript_15439